MKTDWTIIKAVKPGLQTQLGMDNRYYSIWDAVVTRVDSIKLRIMYAD